MPYTSKISRHLDLSKSLYALYRYRKIAWSTAFLKAAIFWISLTLRGPRTATSPEPVEGVVVGDGGSEAAIENHHHLLPYHFHEAYATVVPSPFWDQDHRMPGRLLRKDSFPEFQL